MEMEIVVKELDERNVKDVGRCDGEFTVDSKLVLHVEGHEVRYTIINAPGSKKRYGEDDVDYTAYVGDPDRTIFLAYADGRVAGQIILRRNWNHYAYVEDIAVDVGFRGIGIGKTLISHAKRWAQERNLPGIVLETQDNNVRACKFYESCGFELGGFDKYLYKGLDNDTDEIALYWYLILEDDDE